MLDVAPRRIPFLPLIGLGIVLVAGLIAILIAQSARANDDWATHSMGVQVRIVQLGERLATHDGAMRGYMIARQQEMADEQAATRRDIRSRLAALRMAVADNRDQSRRLDALVPLIERRLAYARELTELRRHTPLSAIDFRIDKPDGLPLVRAIRAAMADLYQAEADLLTGRRDTVRQRIAFLSLGLVATVLLVLCVAYLMVTDARERFDAIDAAHRETQAAAAAAQTEIEARQEAEDQLRQIQKVETLGHLTGGIAHDFNNMLAVVVGSLDLARRRRNDPAQLSANLAAAMDGAERASSLVSRMLAYARRQALAPAPTDPNALVDNMADMLRRMLGKAILIDIDLQPQAWPTFVDPLQLENALVNLAVNARDAMGGRGQMRIATGNVTLDAGTHPDIVPGDYAMIEVGDRGTGMTPDVVARAFDPFFTTKGVGKGTGLGLSQVFGFVTQSGGHVGIETAVGTGSTIRLYLPRHTGTMPSAVDVTLPEPSGTADVGRILVVEDDDRVRRFSIDALTDLGYDVVAAHDGASGLAMLDRTPDIGLLFTDIVMPGMNGIELAGEVATRRPDIRILYTTGYADEASAPRGMMEAGAVVLPKPFTVTQLSRKLVEVIGDAAGPAPAAVQQPSTARRG